MDDTALELAISRCVNEMSLEHLIEYAKESMSKYYTTHATQNEIDELLKEYP